MFQHLERALVSLTRKGIDPGGGYVGVWTRDASEILQGLAAIGRIDEAVQYAQWVWNHRIIAGTRIVRGRGAPAFGFKTRVATEEFSGEVRGALPTSIHDGYVEVYGEYPDIDSTASMVSATARILSQAKSHSMIDQFAPILSQALAYLESRDVDGDSLVEQGPNEDWMDILQRDGKLPHNQALRIRALSHYSKLLDESHHAAHADRYAEVENQTRKRVRTWMKNRWNGLFDPFYQDTVLIVNAGVLSHEDSVNLLDQMRKRLWRRVGPAVLVPTTNRTGPGRIRPNSYQNGGFWPWMTNEEIIARLTLGRRDEARFLLANVLPFALIEWVDPSDPQRSGRYPFKTGLASTIRAAKCLIREHTDLGG